MALEVATESPVGLPGLNFGATGPESQLTGPVVWATFPHREGPVTYVGSDQPEPPDVAAYSFAPAETAIWTLWTHHLPPDRGSYANLLRRVHARLAPQSPLAPWMDLPQAADLAAHGLLTWHYDPDPGVLLETAEP